VVQLLRSLQLVKVFGAHVAQVFLQHGQQLEAAVEQYAVPARDPFRIDRLPTSWLPGTARNGTPNSPSRRKSASRSAPSTVTSPV
jgi:hypothetical protein